MIDLVEMREIRWSQEDQGMTFELLTHRPLERAETPGKWRENLLDHLTHLSDELTELYLAGQEIPPAAPAQGASGRATLTRAFTPVLCGASLRNIGVQPLLDAVVDFLPSPLDVPPAAAIT